MNFWGDFMVYVDEAIGVKAADWNGLSDPYVIVTVKQFGKVVPERRGYDKSCTFFFLLFPFCFLPVPDSKA
jgi:hypothetical protein